VQRLLDEVSPQALASARHCRNLIRQAYNYAIRRDVAPWNPAQFAEVPAPIARERVLADDEVWLIWTTARNPAAVEGLELCPAMGLAICLALVALQRGGQVCGIHAREIDREAKLWTVPGERTKNHRMHVVPLSSSALEVLEAAFAIAQGAGSTWAGYAFPSPRGDAPLTRHALSRAMKRLTRAVAIEDATGHDFRGTGSTNSTGERIGMSRFIISRVLNHISDTGGSAAVTAVYDRKCLFARQTKGFGGVGQAPRQNCKPQLVTSSARAISPSVVLSLLAANVHFSH